MKKIIYIDTSKLVNNNVGGSIYSLLNMAITAKSIGVKPIIILAYHVEYACTICKKHNIEYRFIKKNKINNSQNFNWKKIIPFKNTLKIFKKDKTYYTLLQICKEYGPDSIHGNNRFCSNTQCHRIAEKLKIPYYQHQRMYDKFGFFHKILAKRVTKFVAISQSIKDNIGDNMVEPHKITLIHNWKLIDYLPKLDQERTNSKKIIWIGRLEKWKGFHIALEILKMLKEEDCKCKIDVYGHFNNLEYKEYCTQLINKYQLNSQVNFKGYIKYSDIAYSKYFAFLHTSVKPEPFGRTIIESMLYGIPVCATNMGGVSDIVEHKHSGFLYSPESLFPLVQHLKRLSTDNSFREEYKINGQATFLEKFSGIKQRIQLAKLYEV